MLKIALCGYFYTGYIQVSIPTIQFDFLTSFSFSQLTSVGSLVVNAMRTLLSFVHKQAGLSIRMDASPVETTITTMLPTVAGFEPTVE